MNSLGCHDLKKSKPPQLNNFLVLNYAISKITISVGSAN